MSKYMNVRRMGATLIVLMMVLSASAIAMADNEPNNDFSDAEYLSSYDSVDGTLDSASDQSDFYEIYLIQGYTHTLTLTVTGGTFHLFLYDESETQVSSSTTSGATKVLNYYASSTETHYVEVRAVVGSGSYELESDMEYDYNPTPTEQFDKATPDSVPWSAGDYAASGGYIDLSEAIDELKEEMTADMPEDVSVSVSGSGGIGQYMIFEYVGLDGADYKFDYSCRLYGAIEVSGKMTADDANLDGATMDGKASGKVSATGDLLYEGSLWLAYYENPAKTKAYWGAEKMTLNIEANLELSGNGNMDISAEGMSMEGSVEASATADMDMELTYQATPGIPFMPAKDVDMEVGRTCEVSYSGNAQFDMEMDVTATGMLNTMMGNYITVPDPVHYDGAASGSFESYFTLTYTQATKKAVGPALLNGGWAMIMNLDEIEFPEMGTRADGFETTATFDVSKGMYTVYEPFMGPVEDVAGGVSDTMDMTLTSTTKEDAESFIEDPVAFLESEGVSMPGGSSMMLILLVVVIVVVVVVVVAVVVMKKKKTPPHHPQPYMGGPQQPMYGPQPGYEQPPPQYPPPQQPDQYDNYPPPPPPQQPGY